MQFDTKTITNKIMNWHLFQSACPLRLWGKCPADVMAGHTARSWLTRWPLETPASLAPGNTCGCPTHVVRDDEPDACCWYGSLRQETKSAHFVFSASVPFGRCGSWVGGSLPDLGLHTWWGWAREILVLGCLWLACELRPLSPAGGWYTGPTYRPHNVLFTNSMEMIEKILGMWCQETRFRVTYSKESFLSGKLKEQYVRNIFKVIINWVW